MQSEIFEEEIIKYVKVSETINNRKKASTKDVSKFG